MGKHRGWKEHADMRVEILRSGGAAERASHPWEGRDQFLFDTWNAQTLEDLVACVEQLEEAKFDEWSPGLQMTCPCCVDRVLPDGKSVQDYFELLQGYVMEFARKSDLIERRDVVSVLWNSFCQVDCSASTHGYCSVTGHCSRDLSWHRNHKATCSSRKHAVRGVYCDRNMSRKNCLSRIQVAEGFAQVLCLKMSWQTLRLILDALVEKDVRSDRVSFQAFSEKLVGFKGFDKCMDEERHHTRVQGSKNVAKDFSEDLSRVCRALHVAVACHQRTVVEILEFFQNDRSEKIFLAKFRQGLQTLCGKKAPSEAFVRHVYAQHSVGGMKKGELASLLAEWTIRCIRKLDEKQCRASTSMPLERYPRVAQSEGTYLQTFLRNLYSLHYTATSDSNV